MTTTIYQGNDRPDLKGTISLDGDPDLSGATVAITLVHNNTQEKTVDAQPLSGDIDNSAKTIKWTYELQDGDTDTLGAHTAYLTVTFSDGDVQDVAEDASGDPLLVNIEKPF